MPSASFKNSAYVPKPGAVTKIALEQANAARPKPEFIIIDPVARFMNIVEEARTIAEQTGTYPQGLRKIER